MPDTRYNRADQHVVKTAAHMAEQAGQERHHRARHAGHLDQQSQEDEQRHGQQDQVAHALVHAADQHHQRRPRGQRQISEDRKPERKGNRHAREYAKADHADEENDQVEVAERTQPGRCQPEQRNQQRDRKRGSQHYGDIADAQQPQHGKDRHQADADRQRCRTPGVGDLQRGRCDEAFLVGILVAWQEDQEQEGQRSAGRHDVEIGAQGGFSAGDGGGHAHMFRAVERDHGA